VNRLENIQPAMVDDKQSSLLNIVRCPWTSPEFKKLTSSEKLHPKRCSVCYTDFYKISRTVR